MTPVNQPDPLWEAVIRMESKLDTALQKLDDHEDRLRAAAPQADVDRLSAKVELLALEQANLKNMPFVTPKGLMAAVATSATAMVGIVTLLNQFLQR